jgi:hypothetical protein
MRDGVCVLMAKEMSRRGRKVRRLVGEEGKDEEEGDAERGAGGGGGCRE